MMKMKRVYLWAFLLAGIVCQFSSQAKGQIGLSPSILRDTSHKAGEFDLNIVPFFLAGHGDKRNSLRMTFFLNLGFRKEQEKRISNYGFEFAMPVYLKKLDSSEPPTGFYIAPVYRLLLKDFFSFDDAYVKNSLLGEVGYSFNIADEFGISLGIQYGTTRYSILFEPEYAVWKPQWHFTVTFGRFDF